MWIDRFFLLWIYVFVLIAYNGSELWAQQVEVLDKEDESPIAYATVTNLISSNHTIASEMGIADLSEFSKKIDVIISALGYYNDTLAWNEINQYQKIYLEKEDFLIDEVVVSVPRWSNHNSNKIHKVKNIERSSILLNNPQTSADLLGKSGEVFIQKSQQGGGSPMIRGFAANRLVYSIDGVRMNTAIFRGGNLHNVLSIDPLSVENTEILLGPGSVSYGSDAIGGVMAFHTLGLNSVEKTLEGNALLRYSSANNEKTIHSHLGFKNKAFSSITSFTFNRFGDLVMGRVNSREEYLNNQYVARIGQQDTVLKNVSPHEQKGTGFDQYHLMQKLGYRWGNGVKLSWNNHFSTTSNFNRYDRLIQLNGDQPKSAEWYYGPQIWWMSNVTLNVSKKNNWYDHANFVLANQYFKESRHDRKLHDLFRRSREERVNALSFNADFIKQIEHNFLLAYGIESVYNKVNSEGISTSIVNSNEEKINARYPTSTWVSNAAFINVSSKLNDRWLLQCGGRINQYSINSSFDTTLFSLPFNSLTLNNIGFSGSLGATFSMTKNWSISGLVASGFRAPNVDDTGKIFDSSPGNVVVPNGDLSSEKALNFELGIKGKLTSIFELDFSIYRTRLRDGLIRRPFQFMGQDSIFYDGELSRVEATINAAHIDIVGLQLGMKFRFPYEIRVKTVINIQSGEEELEDGSKSPSRHVAPSFARIMASKEYNNWHFEVNGVFSQGISAKDLPITETMKPHIYAKDDDGRPYSPSWFVLNSTVKYALKSNLSISFSIENILDHQYRPYSSGLVAAGRNIVFTANYNFNGSK